jgi:polysaccharide export outer membrane protein
MAYRLRLVTLGVALAVLAGCGSSGSYLWVDDLPKSSSVEVYRIAVGDTLNVRVYNQENLSTHSKVRSDGRIAVPLVGDVEVRAKTPAVVAREIEGRLKQYVVSPAVTVTVEESQPTTVAVLGEVAHPGVYTVDPSSGVLQALAAAGGFTDFASRESIYVVRKLPPQRIRFSWTALLDGDKQADAFRLHKGDVVVVE